MNIKTLNIVSLDDGLIIKKRGASAGGDASNIEYLDMRNLEYEVRRVLNEASLVLKIPQDTIIEDENLLSGDSMVLPKGIYPPSFFFTMLSEDLHRGNYGFINAEKAVVACCIDLSVPVCIGAIGAQTIKENIIARISQEQFDAIPRITKEQFYDLNS